MDSLSAERDLAFPSERMVVQLEPRISCRHHPLTHYNGSGPLFSRLEHLRTRPLAQFNPHSQGFPPAVQFNELYPKCRDASS